MDRERATEKEKNKKSVAAATEMRSARNATNTI